jgi:hypothetical protein
MAVVYFYRYLVTGITMPMEQQSSLAFCLPHNNQILQSPLFCTRYVRSDCDTFVKTYQQLCRVSLVPLKYP